MHLKRTTAANPGQPVDLQPLFLNLTMDISTHFLLGKSVGALRRFTTTTTTTKEDSSRDREKDGGFSSAFNIALEYAPIRTILGDFYWLFSPPRFLRACRAVHDFVGQYAQTALNTSQKKDEEEGGEEGRQVFLQALAAETQDPVVIKDQVLSVLLAGRDSTAASLAWTFHSLARHPEVLRRLRQEILECTSGGPPAAEELGDMKYLRWTLNEGIAPLPFPFLSQLQPPARTIARCKYENDLHHRHHQQPIDFLLAACDNSCRSHCTVLQRLPYSVPTNQRIKSYASTHPSRSTGAQHCGQRRSPPAAARTATSPSPCARATRSCGLSSRCTVELTCTVLTPAYSGRSAGRRVLLVLIGYRLILARGLVLAVGSPPPPSYFPFFSSSLCVLVGLG